jgi:NADP-dependent 3-hydroxy acid dehydrogenase YdfG
LLCTDVDYKGVVYGTQLAIHFMRKNRTPGGKIVVTASVAGVVPHESYPEYDGAKAAVGRPRDDLKLDKLAEGHQLRSSNCTSVEDGKASAGAVVTRC